MAEIEPEYASEAAPERKHHKQAEIAYNRPDYREAKWEKAVKVYTVNQESCYLLVQNIHALGVTKDLLDLFSLYGDIDEYRILDDYPSEPYTDVYWIKYVNINAARVAKRKLDNRSFFGKSLHICYAPEYESVQETRGKLQQRRKIIAQKTRETFEKAQKEKLAAAHSSDTTSDLALPTECTTHAHGHPVQISIPEQHQQPYVKSHDSHPTAHEFNSPLPVDYHIPGLPPVPQLPLPPSQDSFNYPSAHDESVNVLSREPYKTLTTHSDSTETQRDSSLAEGGRHLASEDSEFKQHKGGTHSSAINPSGLTTSKRVALYLETAQEQGLPVGKESACSKTRSAAQTPKAKKCATTVSVTSASTTVGSYPRQVSRHSSMAPAQEPEAIPVSARIVHPPQITTGSKSVDQSIQSIREHMTKVWETAGEPPARPKLKKRKRI